MEDLAEFGSGKKARHQSLESRSRRPQGQGFPFEMTRGNMESLNWSCNVSETEEEQLNSSSDEEKGKKKISLSNLSKLMNKIYSDDFERLTHRNLKQLSSKKLS